MKIKITLLIANLFLGGLFSFAGNEENTLTQKINRKISYPSSLAARKIETTVNVSVFINQNRELIIQSIDSENQEMSDAIREQLRKLKFTPTEEMIGQTFQYRFVMKIQK